MQVIRDAAVPGIFKRIAEIRPPENPPIYSPIKIEILGSIFMAKVMGKNRATAMVVESPGIAPKTKPMITPPQINKIFCGDRVRIAVIKFSNICLSS